LFEFAGLHIGIAEGGFAILDAHRMQHAIPIEPGVQSVQTHT
jgi:hypothetical protein